MRRDGSSEKSVESSANDPGVTTTTTAVPAASRPDDERRVTGARRRIRGRAAQLAPGVESRVDGSETRVRSVSVCLSLYLKLQTRMRAGDEQMWGTFIASCHTDQLSPAPYMRKQPKNVARCRVNLGLNGCKADTRCNHQLHSFPCTMHCIMI
jgi:hypothetical protein